MILRALIFDCDGVLADTERDGHLPAFNATFEQLGLPVRWTDAEYARLVEIGGGKERMATLFSGALRGTRWDGSEDERRRLLQEWHAQKTQQYVALVAAGRLPARPGVARLAREAADAGVALAVASTSAEASVRAVLRHAVGAELARRFHVSAGDVVARKKPAPDIYVDALQALGVDASEAVAIEDSGVGCRAAVAAGIRTVITTSAYTLEDSFDGAALVVSDLGEPEAGIATVVADPEEALAGRDMVDLAALSRLR